MLVELSRLKSLKTYGRFPLLFFINEYYINNNFFVLKLFLKGL